MGVGGRREVEGYVQFGAFQPVREIVVWSTRSPWDGSTLEAASQALSFCSAAPAPRVGLFGDHDVVLERTDALDLDPDVVAVG